MHVRGVFGSFGLAIDHNSLTPDSGRLAPLLLPLAAEFHFVLAGGAALALQIGHRVSVGPQRKYYATIVTRIAWRVQV